MFLFWLSLTIFQILIHFFPMDEWIFYYLTVRCWLRRCRCGKKYVIADVSQDNVRVQRIVRNEYVKAEFINSTWNMLERKSLTREQRILRDPDKYFGGYKGRV